MPHSREDGIVKTDGCWYYLGKSADSNGYVRVYVGGGREHERKRYVHVLAWEDYHGRPVPDGYVVHHTCSTRNCVRPTHLELKDRGQHTAEHMAERRGGWAVITAK
jgi:hypothetical protein